MDLRFGDADLIMRIILLYDSGSLLEYILMGTLRGS